MLEFGHGADYRRARRRALGSLERHRIAGGNAMKFAETIAAMIDEVDRAVFPDVERMP